MEPDKKISINCDVGEGLGNEAKLFPLIDACNIACGGHAGDAKSIKEIITLAKTQDVDIGAHPSFPDKKNFGRKRLAMSTAELTDSLLSQIRLFTKIATGMGEKMRHIKLHGALYNAVMGDEELSEWYSRFHHKYFPKTKLFVLPDSVLEHKASSLNIPIIKEGFLDRAYTAEGKLAPRSTENSLLTDSQQVEKHLKFYLKHSRFKQMNANTQIDIDTFCIHGDNPAAIEILEHIDVIKHGL